MVNVPEEEKEQLEVQETENEKESRQTAQRTGVGFGFLLGVAATLFVIVSFLAGWSVAGRRSWEKKGIAQESEEESGARILTDGETLEKLGEIQTLIEQNYLDAVDSEMLSTYLYKGIAAGLDDPYADYYSPEELESIMDSSRGSYTGIGVSLLQDTKSGQITVEEVYEGMPADLAGIREGDVLLAVDETGVTENTKLNELVSVIKGMKEPFYMKLYRPGTDEELELEIELGSVEVPAVAYEMKEEGIGYIRIREFTESAVGQFREAAKELKNLGMEKLIVDLRNNPGGLLNSVCDILDEVLPERLLVYTEDKYGTREEYYSDKKQTVDCEIAVLVDEGSASASEIFAGAVQDYKLGPIIGTTTYGKGIVQKTFPLSDGSAFKMTVEKYFTPLGQDIHGNGIVPDIVVEEAADGERTEAQEGTEAAGGVKTGAGADSDPVLKKALEVLTEGSFAAEAY